MTCLIKYPSLRRHFLPQVVCLLTISISYYGGVLATSLVGMSIYWNLVINGLAETLAYILGS